MLEHDRASEFDPSDNMKQDPESALYEAIHRDLIEEVKAGGPYRLTDAGREFVKQLKEDT